jgi:hypothetical protein
MSLALKVVLGIAGLALLLGLGFYLWLVVAYEPPRPAEPRDISRVVKQGEIEGVAYVITWTAADENSPRTYDLASGLSSDRLGTQQWLRAKGRPAPVDVRVARKQVLEVLFDGPLPDGGSSMLFEMDQGWRRLDLVDLENGKRINAP